MDIVFHLLNDNDNNSRNDIKIYIVNMKSVIKSVAILRHPHVNNIFIVSVQTKSNKIVEYNFDSLKLARQYYNDIVS